MQNRNNSDYRKPKSKETMRLLKKEPVTSEGTTYEVRVYGSDAVISAVAFRNNYPADGLRHQILLPGNCKLEDLLKEPILDDLIEMSKMDILENRWKKLSAAFHKNCGDTARR